MEGGGQDSRRGFMEGGRGRREGGHGAILGAECRGACQYTNHSTPTSLSLSHTSPHPPTTNTKP